MKNKISTLKLGAIKELSRAEQKTITGGGPLSPCCPSSPYYNTNSCWAYSGHTTSTGGYSWC